MEWIINSKLNNINNLQLIIDLQNYIIKKNTYYIGNWHREGFKNNEYIKCGVIYYINKTDNFFNNDIFEIKSEGHQICGGDFSAEYKININKNNLIVFDNDQLIHRLGKLDSIIDNRIKTNFKYNIIQQGYRTHLLLLLPKYQIRSMLDFNVNNYYTMPRVLSFWIEMFDNTSKLQFPIDLFNIMLNYLDISNINLINSEKSLYNKRNESRKKRMFIGDSIHLYLGATN